MSGAGGGAIILPDGAGAFAAGAALAAGFLAGAFPCIACILSYPGSPRNPPAQSVSSSVPLNLERSLWMLRHGIYV